MRSYAGDTWLLEDKYDGVRVQAHLRDGERRALFATAQRRERRLSRSRRGAGALARDAIFDGEIVAMRDGRVLPFRMLQARLQRKVVDESLVREVPIAYVVFDLFARGGDLLIDEPLSRRRESLADLFAAGAHLSLRPSSFCESRPAQVNERFEAARARGNEGLMLKRADAPYLPGRRGKWWLKLKRELSTLDVVVVAVEWGHGKRSAVSPITRSPCAANAAAC